MIRALVSGTLHGEPVQRTSQSGNNYCTAKLRADSKDNTATWVSLIAFGDVAEHLSTLKAGDALAVSGRAEVQGWLDKAGEPKAGLSLVVDELVTLKGKPRPPQEESRQPERPRRAYRRPNGTRHTPPGLETGPAFDDLDSWQP